MKKPYFVAELLPGSNGPRTGIIGGESGFGKGTEKKQKAGNKTRRTTESASGEKSSGEISDDERDYYLQGW
jgi:hypothetical protein